jgi:hypothetical protein
MKQLIFPKGQKIMCDLCKNNAQMFGGMKYFVKHTHTSPQPTCPLCINSAKETKIFLSSHINQLFFSNNRKERNFKVQLDSKLEIK